MRCALGVSVRMKQARRNRVLLFLGGIGCVLLLALAAERFFAPDARATRLASRLANIICVYREEHGRWPDTLAAVPKAMLGDLDVSRVEYDRQQLTLKIPVSVVRPHRFANLWHTLRRSGLREQTETTGISVPILTRYYDRNPSLVDWGVVEGEVSESTDVQRGQTERTDSSHDAAD